MSLSTYYLEFGHHVVLWSCIRTRTSNTNVYDNLMGFLFFPIDNFCSKILNTCIKN